MGDQSKRARGRWGEDVACRHLRRHGYEILDRNWRSPETYLRGELDIVARQDATLVFCEVKARRRAGYGGAASAVDDRKQEQIRVLAESWLRTVGADSFGDADVEGVRFDVVAIDGVHLEHLTGAF